MLSKMIVSSYEALIEIALWLFLIICVVGGFKSGGMMGAIGGIVIGFVVSVMFFGAFLVLADIRKSVIDIANRN